MVEGGGGGAGELMELCAVEVVEEYEKAEGGFDGGEGVFGSEVGDCCVIHDEDGDRLSAVDFIGELCLREEVIEGGVVWEGRQDLCDAVDFGGDCSERKCEKQDV